MKSYIYLLILLDFIRIVFCCQSYNISTAHNHDNDCPISLFRRKRSNAEYTRWRANMETTPQFIVKVLDEEATTPLNNQVVAVNIFPVTKRPEKIIIGGAMVPSHTTEVVLPGEVSPASPREYTRFVPPTAIDTRKEGDLYLAPAYKPTGTVSGDSLKSGTSKHSPLKGALPQMQFVAKPHALRDESPPSGPQFLARSREPPPILAQQFAPITPVAFNRRVSVSPLMPPHEMKIMHHQVLHQHGAVQNLERHPTRTPHVVRTTTSATAMITRTTSDDLAIFNTYPDEDLETTVRRTTTRGTPERTTIKTTTEAKRDFLNHDEDFEGPPPTKKPPDLQDDINEKDPDASYNNIIFDSEDDQAAVGGSNKTDADVADEDRLKLEDNKVDSEMGAFNLEVDTTTDKSTAKEDYYDYVESATEKNASLAVLEPALKEPKDRQKRQCSLIKIRKPNFSVPRTLPEITAQLKHWAENSPLARWLDITEGNLTVMENPIFMMIIDDPSNGQIVSAKHTVMIVAGILGRDHFAVAGAMYILSQLIEHPEAQSHLLTKYRFWIIPVLNPDGYDYSMTFPHRQDWCKNLRQNWDYCEGRGSCKSCELQGIRCTIQPCFGVNLDRNFEYQWIPIADKKLQATNPCGSLFAGKRQLSEVETKALTQYLHRQQHPLHTFLAFKEGDVLGIMYPYSHSKNKRAFDKIARQRASRAAAAARTVSGRSYVAGQTSEFLTLYAGGIEDWVDGHLGIDNTYTIMLSRPMDRVAPHAKYKIAVLEAFAAMDTLLRNSIVETEISTHRPTAAPAAPAAPPVRLTRRLNKANLAERTRPSYVITLLAVLLSCPVTSS